MDKKIQKENTSNVKIYCTMGLPLRSWMSSNWKVSSACRVTWHKLENNYSSSIKNQIHKYVYNSFITILSRFLRWIGTTNLKRNFKTSQYYFCRKLNPSLFSKLLFFCRAGIEPLFSGQICDVDGSFIFAASSTKNCSL